MAKSFRFLFLLGSLGLAACMAPGTQTATPTGSSGAVEAGSKGEDPSIAGESGGTVDPGSDPVEGLPPSSPSSPPSPSPSGRKWPGSIFAENVPTGLPSGQVAPDEAVGDEGKLALRGTQEPLCRTPKDLTKIRIIGHLVLVGPESKEEKKAPVFPVRLRVYYKDGEQGRGGNYVDAEFEDKTAKTVVLTSDPSSLGFFLVNAFTNEVFEIPSRLEEIAPPSSSPLPICPSRFIEPAKNFAPLVSPH